MSYLANASTTPLDALPYIACLVTYQIHMPEESSAITIAMRIYMKVEWDESCTELAVTTTGAMLGSVALFPGCIKVVVAPMGG